MNNVPLNTPKDELEFPVFLNDGRNLPKTGDYYVVAKNGTWVHKDTKFLTSTVKVNQIGFLQAINAPQIEYKLPKIDLNTFFKAVMFFKKIFKTYGSESVLILVYSESSNKYDLVCPKQTVAYMSIDYDPEVVVPEGYVQIGTIHSHCDFNASHSSTDIRDENFFDGIHITVGHVNKAKFSLACSLVISGGKADAARASKDPLDYIDGIKSTGKLEKCFWYDSMENRFGFDFENFVVPNFKEIVLAVESYFTLVEKRHFLSKIKNIFQSRDVEYNKSCPKKAPIMAWNWESQMYEPMIDGKPISDPKERENYKKYKTDKDGIWHEVNDLDSKNEIKSDPT